jgi:hypothetical protein
LALSKSIPNPDDNGFANLPLPTPYILDRFRGGPGTALEKPEALHLYSLLHAILVTVSLISLLTALDIGGLYFLILDLYINHSVNKSPKLSHLVFLLGLTIKSIMNSALTLKSRT